jgi:uncharacterized membrane protein YphA (DoxX/SURF4 family)
MGIMNRPTSTPSRSASVLEKLRSVATFLGRPSIGQPTGATLLVRLAVGSVFVSSGIVKFLFDNQGPGRFARVGFPHASALAMFVGTTEVVCGTLVILGLFVRLASVPLVVDMLVAIATTKIPLLFGVGPEAVAAPPKTGFWAFAYQARLDVTMLLACSFLVVAGAGLLSLDALLSRRRWEERLMRDPRVGGTGSPAT